MTAEVKAKIPASAAVNPRDILSDRFIRVKEVAQMVGLSITSIYALVKKDPNFPKPIRIGERMNVWSRNSVAAWIEAVKASQSR